MDFIKITIILFFITETIFASGYTLPVFGTRNLSRGGAFLSKADDLTAIATNPANMIKFKGLNSYISLGLIKTSGSIDYDRRFTKAEIENSDVGGDITKYNKTIKNDTIFPNPTIIISDNFGMKKFNFSFGVYGPYAPDYNYDKECAKDPKKRTCANRYGLYKSDITQADINFTIAYQVMNNLSLGLSIKNSYINFVYDLDIISAMNNTDDLNAKAGLYDMNFKFDVTDYNNPNIKFGLTYEPIDTLAISFTYQSPFTVDANGKLNSTPNSYEYKGDEKNVVNVALPKGLQDKDLNVKINLPHIFTLGLLYDVKNFFNIELDFSYEMWQSHDKIVITPIDVSVNFGLGDVKLKPIEQIKNWKNTMRFSLGGDYIINGNLTISAGTFYEQGAIPDEYFDNSIVDSDKIGYSLGGAYQLNNYSIYLSFAYIDFFTRDIKNSKVTPGNSFKNEKLAKEFIIGNGVYDTDIIILGLGVNAKF